MTSVGDEIEVVLPRRTGPDGLQIRSKDAGGPAPGAVRLRMEATGVSFAEQQMLRGTYFDQPSFPFVPGYDLVGTAIAVGEGVDQSTVGRRFAAVVKTGAWASTVDIPGTDLLTVPDDLDPAAVEAVIVNGITAWQTLHSAAVRSGGTVVVLGANGGVGTILVQLAQQVGLRVMAVASAPHHDLLRSLGADVVIDRHDPELPAQLHRHAPDGVDAVFDHVGGKSLAESWRLLRRGGALVSYGSASTKDRDASARSPILGDYFRLLTWNLLPNGRSARLYNLWAGRRRRGRFIARQQRALTAVLELVEAGSLRPQIAARLALSDIVHAVELAESHTIAGKVVIIPDV